MADEVMAQIERGASGLDALADHTDPNARISVCTITDFLAKEFPPRENILAPWLQRQGLAMIHARRGVGKTHVGLGIAFAVASGGTFLCWTAEKPRGVLYIDGEMPASTMQDRLKALVTASERKAEAPLKILTPDLQPSRLLNLANRVDQEELENELGDVELIVVDNLSCLVRGGSENEAESWQPVQDWVLTQRARGRSVVLLHHDGKGGQQRGTSKKEDVLDTVIQLVSPKDHSPRRRRAVRGSLPQESSLPWRCSQAV
jgi:RecA-family ATPase